MTAESTTEGMKEKKEDKQMKKPNENDSNFEKERVMKFLRLATFVFVMVTLYYISGISDGI